MTDQFKSIVGEEGLLTNEEMLDYAKDYTKKHTPQPLAVTFPKTTEQVQELLKYCNKNKIAVVPSGGRTGLAGGAVAANKEVVLSLKKMNKVFSINTTDQTLHCQSGVITKEVQKQAEGKGLYFPVDFASSGSSHIGGNIATNAGGIKVIRYGLMRDWVLGLQVVTASGEILNMMNGCVKNNTGYDLKHLFIGAEGTLGVITECLIKLTIPPSELSVSLLATDSLEKVIELFKLAKKIKLPLTAYEFFAHKALEKVTEHTQKKSPFAQVHSFYALLEIEKRTASDESLLEKYLEEATESELIQDGAMASNSQQEQDFWALRENIAESLSMTSIVHKNDISLPISKISEFCKELQKLIDQKYQGFEVVNFGHIGDGNLHVNFIKPGKMTKEDFFAHAQKADSEMFSLVRKHGGSISAEHGIGMIKKDFLHYTRSVEEISLMRSIKKVLDPENILNPGKIL